MVLKTNQQIEDMRVGGKILAQILSEIKNSLKPGISTMSLEKKAEELFEKFKVKPAFKGFHGYPYILCTSVNENVVHNFPSEKQILQDGDFISIDCGVIYNDLYTDHAVSDIVGKDLNNLKKFLQTAHIALEKGINEAIEGNTVGDIGFAIQEVVEKAGYSIIKDLVGHGVGMDLHESPQIPNFGKKSQGEKLIAGMTLAIEPIISVGSGQIKTLDNGWDIVTKDNSISCQVEHTVLVQKDYAEILTLV